MLEKLKNAGDLRDFLMKALSIVIVIAILFLSLDVFSNNRDGRRQIVDSDGGTETSLEVMLSDIKGAGDVTVMMKENNDGEVKGVIVTATGAGNPVVKNDLINAVAVIFDIPTSNVVVFEKNGGKSDE
ncbi:MAG: hypothetical protein PHX63_04445 [Eubacteriales bacterium]|nr:hypothetical protein [Eubacteriales bacterium]